MFASIKAGTYTWPKEPKKAKSFESAILPSPRVRDFVASLLRQTLPKSTHVITRDTCAQRPFRLGAGPADFEDIRAHSWFEGFNFDELLSGIMAPPFVPKLACCDDDGNFGPIEWRGDPVVHEPKYDAGKWDSAWKSW